MINQTNRNGFPKWNKRKPKQPNPVDQRRLIQIEHDLSAALKRRMFRPITVMMISANQVQSCLPYAITGYIFPPFVNVIVSLLPSYEKKTKNNY